MNVNDFILCKYNFKMTLEGRYIILRWFGVNESISLVLEASCSTAYILVLSLDMVETTPLLMHSTPDG